MMLMIGSMCISSYRLQQSQNKPEKRVFPTSEQDSHIAYKKAVLPRGNCAMPQVFFSVEVRHNNIPYKYKTSHASKATLQSSKHAGAKHNLTQNQDSKSFNVTCLESVEKQ